MDEWIDKLRGSAVNQPSNVITVLYIIRQKSVVSQLLNFYLSSGEEKDNACSAELHLVVNTPLCR